MELWIRSQDKTQLAQITGLLLNDNEIRGFTNYHQNYYELGTYKTKERALEVLDEIQAILSPKLKTTLTKDGLNVEVIDKNYDVYQMPEKEEKKEEQEG